MSAHRLGRGIVLAALLASVGCRALEWMGGITHAQLEDPQMKPYLDAAAQSARAERGFSELPVEGLVGVEVPRSKKYYDVMLHIDRGRVTRTVDFLLKGTQPVWSGEQEIHYSGREFDTVDGRVG